MRALAAAASLAVLLTANPNPKIIPMSLWRTLAS